ncbi:hypothetical protein HDV57DRAFT_344629 [Trichoderma longibrachiatum]|uniref:Uncharacterized protein n=1 Tax=Trichoderma longibrachiatum ATCC 18648 TaxID=983965 RepID=A0A2T4BY09_TRILO|nr:hypothetical protein M440DRAFT_110903 [Trichoderma longibrachiatum ATCC 18648]
MCLYANVYANVLPPNPTRAADAPPVPRALDQKLQVVCRLHAQDAVNGVAVTHTSPHAATTPVLFFFSLLLCPLAPLLRPPRRKWAPCPFFSLLLRLLLVPVSCVYAVACNMTGFWLPPATKTALCFSDPRRREGH